MRRDIENCSLKMDNKDYPEMLITKVLRFREIVV